MSANDSIFFRLRKINVVGNKKDAICSNNISLSSHKPTTFGRVQSSEVQVRLLSKATPLMISRKHATIFVDKGFVTICDHSSINGVYIEDLRIASGVPHPVKVGERIAFGCGVGNNPPEFEFVLESQHKTPAEITVNLVSPSKRQKTVDSPALTIIESNAAQIKEQEEKIKKLTADLELKELIQSELVDKLEKTEKGLVGQLEMQKQELESLRNTAEEKLKILLENQLREKENILRTEYDQQIKCLQFEKDSVEMNLHAELSKKLSDKDKAYQQVLEQQKRQLADQMLFKETERNSLLAELQAKEGLIEKYKSVEENQRQLEDCLEELKKEILEKEQLLKQQLEVTKKIEVDAKQTVIQTMEDEFTCIICQELFIDSTTLPCAHTFCEICLRSWLRKKKNCPVCRRKIKDKAVRSLVLDSAVEKMIESMSDDVKQRRSVIVNERLEQKRKDDATEDPDGVKSLFHQLGEDSTSGDEAENQRIDRNHDNRNRRVAYRREGYSSRRSRSRSPRYHQRHRPYHQENRSYQNNNYIQGFHHPQHNNNNITPLLQHYQEPRGNHFFQGNANAQQYYNHQSIRCYNCGGTDHIARFCPRR